MRIENIDQLNVEIGKLEAKSAELKSQLIQDYEELKEELKPMNIFLDAVSGISGFKISRNSLFEKGFSYGTRFLLQRLFMTTGLGLEKQAAILIEKAAGAISRFLKKIFNRTPKGGEKDEAEEDERNPI